ncbi:glycosyltransferase, partial [Escherichia coli]|uniref:glycosyltransferase n=1 Tax=Escherichia coli TaxID=562 RepID=UPI001F4111ED
MATYNGGEYVYTQLNSILKQLGRNDELIISDDGSTDNTINIIEKYNDPRIKLIRHDRGWLDPKTPLLSRVKKNFEEAIRLATGEFIFLSDQDDIWLPGRVEECLAEFKNGFDLIVCDCIVTDKNKILFSSYCE